MADKDFKVKNGIEVGGNAVISGNLTVSGTTTTINTETVTINDNIIVLNNNATGTPSENAGIEVERGDSTNASILWDESTDTWKAGLVGSESEIINASSTGQTKTGNFTSSGDITAGGLLKSTQSLTNEGGEIQLSAPSSGSTLSGPIIIDIYQNKLRFFENGGTARGYYIDLTTGGAGAGTNLVGSGSGTVTSVDMTVPTGLTVSGNPITTSGTLAVTLTAGYSIPTTSSQTNWDSAYTDRLKWDGGSTGLTASTGRTSLGATTVGSNLFTLTNPSAITFLRVNADNTVSALDAATFRTAIGAGTSSTTGTVTSIATSTGLTGGTITTTGTLSIDTAVVPQLSAGNAFTGANTFTNGSGITVRNAATQDGIIIDGRAGGTTSLAVTLVPTTLTASRTLTLPDVTGTVITNGDTGSVTNAMLAGSIANAKLANSTISGISLGSNLAALTISTGLSGTSYNGSTGVTIAIDSTVATLTGSQTLTNKTLTLPTIGGTGATFNGSTSGTTVLKAAATAGTTTITMPATTGTMALTSDIPTVNNGTLTLSIGSAAGTNNTVTVGTGTGFSANTSSNATYSLSIGPALTALASIMTGASTGVLNKSAADTFTLVSVLTNPMTTTGDVIYSSSGSTPARLGIGTAGQALVVNSGATAPSWTTLTLENLPGAFIKKAVRAATTADLGGTYSNGTSGVGATLTITSTTTLDGVTLANGDRILVKDQATTLQNGIYIRTSATVLTRATDADSPGEISAGIVAVDEGTTNGGITFDTDFKATDTIGTTAMTWNRMVDAASTFYVGTTAITAGRASANLALTGITSITSGTGNTAIALNTAATATTSTASGAININTGNATGTTSNSGSIGIDVGTATLTKGGISIGTTNANTVNIGNSSATVNIYTSTLDVQNGPIVTSSQSNNPTSTSGVYLGSAGKIHAAVNGGTVMQLNRNTSDGEIIGLYQAATLEGSISVSGTTVTYGSFAGTHWSQFANNERPDILPGTVLENTGEMCNWAGEENEQLTRVKISDTEDSSGVYGVFMRYDNDDEDYPNDVYVLALGAWMVRVDADEVVFVGDLLSSKGNGCAKVQDDDIVRSKTIGKVTSAVPVTVYPDGSKLIPCVLYCG